MLILIPKSKKNHTGPLSYRPIALSSCLCKVLGHKVNAHFIWKLEKSGILDKNQCGLRKHDTTDHIVSLERYLQDAFAQEQYAVSLYFDSENVCETTGQYGMWDIKELASKANCPFSFQYISGTTELESELGPHSMVKSTQRKLSQQVVSWLWHVLDWR